MKRKNLIRTAIGAGLLILLLACDDPAKKSGSQILNSAGVSDVIKQNMKEADKEKESSKAESDFPIEEEIVRKSGINEGAPEPEEIPDDMPRSETEGIDVDLTALSSTMVYAEVYSMATSPEDYLGKTIKMEGTCYTVTDIVTGKTYYACIVQDATACCAQGIEFDLAEDKLSGDYPKDGDTVCVVGTFGTYEEAGNTYCTLKDAVLH
ncbi:MAG: hypothetical protein K5858_08180 [Lachnospiraceae bacterium]|nr:hypothetical protein [Lachnospiraceae bacterium]